jgi:NADH-quinone oxidoreductase subunit I
MKELLGNGLLRGLGITFKRFIDTYLDDIKWLGKRYYTKEGISHRSDKEGRGIFTVQYPEEKVPPGSIVR